MGGVPKKIMMVIFCVPTTVENEKVAMTKTKKKRSISFSSFYWMIIFRSLLSIQSENPFWLLSSQYVYASSFEIGCCRAGKETRDERERESARIRVVENKIQYFVRASRYYELQAEKLQLKNATKRHTHTLFWRRRLLWRRSRQSIIVPKRKKRATTMGHM